MEKLINDSIEKIKARIVKHFQPEKIILFGSYAYGIPKENSDIDLLVIKESDLPKHKRITEILSILRDFDVGIEPIVYTPEEVEEWKNVSHAFVTSIMNKGKVIYER